jgi:hypothetical protein
MLLQELGQEKTYISETLFTTIFISFALVRISCLSFNILFVVLYDCILSAFNFVSTLW